MKRKVYNFLNWFPQKLIEFQISKYQKSSLSMLRCGNDKFSASYSGIEMFNYLSLIAITTNNKTCFVCLSVKGKSLIMVNSGCKIIDYCLSLLSLGMRGLCLVEKIYTRVMNDPGFCYQHNRFCHPEMAEKDEIFVYQNG